MGSHWLRHADPRLCTRAVGDLRTRGWEFGREWIEPTGPGITAGTVVGGLIAAQVT